MKNKLLQILLMIFIFVALPACTQGNGGENVGTVPEAECPEAKPGSHQLKAASQGLCFLYPENYDVSQNESGGFSLYTRSLLHTETPIVSFSFEQAADRSLDDITTQRLTDFAFPDTQSQQITLGGQPAVMFDNLPGQDTNRRVVAIHDDIVVDLFLTPVGANYGAVADQAESLYKMIIDSFQFIPVETGASLVAGPECPEPVENSMIYTNEPAGYCLLVPATYTAQETNPSEMAFFVGTIQDVTHARMFITTEDANGRSLVDVSTAKETEVETAMPGFDVMWSFGYALDGVPANQFDQLPGQDLSREVVMVHDGRIYTLTFIPDDPSAGDAYTEMETLYNMVMDSFSFTWGK